jgi:NADH dehydrogenase FAD-containing subunit
MHVPRGPIVTSVQQRGSATDLATAHGREAKRRGPSASLATVTIWTGGGRSPDLWLESGLSADRGPWAPVPATLESRTHRRVFVVGDAAELPARVPKQACHAMDTGTVAADNIEALTKGRQW